MKKLIFSAFLALLFSTMSTMSIEVSAHTSSTSIDNKIGGQELVIDDASDGISDVLSFDELISEISINDNISETQARNELLNSLTKDNKRSLSSTSAAVAATYRTISTSVSVTSTYKPTIKYYCQTTEGGGFRGIKKILKVSLNRNYRGTSKAFGGEIYTRLEDPNRIFYILNGDFYNNGSTTVNGSVNIGIGKAASVSFGGSYTSKHYKYAYKQGYKSFWILEVNVWKKVHLIFFT